MEVFRLSRAAFARDLNGKGAALRGARWNSKGVELIYTAMNRSLAMAEVAVHLTLATLPDDYQMIAITLPEDVTIDEVDLNELPSDWNVFPHPISTQKIGDQFVREGKYGILKIPSSVTKGDFNMLINPNHVDFKRIAIKSIEPFPFDRRIFR